MEISSRHFLLGMENLLDACLPKIKPPASFFPLKVLEYIMEITLNLYHKFCGQTTCQSLSAANSGFQI